MSTLTTRVIRKARKLSRLRSGRAGRRRLKLRSTTGTRYRSLRRTMRQESAPVTFHSSKLINCNSGNKRLMTSEHSAFTFVHDAVRQQGTVHPNQPAVIDQSGNAIDYAELCARS